MNKKTLLAQLDPYMDPLDAQGNPIPQPTPSEALGFSEPNVTGDEVNVMGVPRRNIDIPSEPAQFNVSPPVQPNGVPTPIVQQSYQDKFAQILQDPERAAKLKELYDRSKQAIDEQRQGVQGNEKDLAALQASPTAPNLAPLLNLADTWTGSHLAQGYKAPETEQERQLKIMAIKDALQKQRQGLSQEEINLLKGQMSQNDMKTLLQQQAMGTRLDQRQNTIGQREDAIAAQAVKNIESHPAMSQMNKQSIAIDRGIHTIDQNGILTPETFAEIERDYGNAISGGGVFGEYALQRIEAPGLGRNLARLKEKWGNKPIDLRQESPEVVNQLRTQLMRLRQSYGESKAQLVDQLTSGLDYAHTPAAQQALEGRKEFYRQNAENMKTDIPNPNPMKKKGIKAPTAAPGLSDNLDNMSPEELQQWIETHGK